MQVLPHLGSAWSRHGSVLVDSENRVMVLTELAALYYTGSNRWLEFSSNLPSKPRSPVLVSDSHLPSVILGHHGAVSGSYSLAPWRSQAHRPIIGCKSRGMSGHICLTFWSDHALWRAIQRIRYWWLAGWSPRGHWTHHAPQSWYWGSIWEHWSGTRQAGCPWRCSAACQRSQSSSRCLVGGTGCASQGRGLGNWQCGTTAMASQNGGGLLGCLLSRMVSTGFMLNAALARLPWSFFHTTLKKKEWKDLLLFFSLLCCWGCHCIPLYSTLLRISRLKLQHVTVYCPRSVSHESRLCFQIDGRPVYPC